MKKVFLFIAMAGFLALLFLPPRKQDTVQPRNTNTRAPLARPGSLYNVATSQNTSSNTGTQLASPAVADFGPRPEFNPPHGQPWHRCEIPVGAPLNSAPSSGNTNPRQTATQQTTAQQTANTALASNTTRPSLNPPHGEPFHRCDIPVGAPLDSPPRSTNTQTTTNTAAATQAQETITPIIQQTENGQMITSAANTAAPENIGEKPALNPPHGQPWHRCDIRVGDPLP